MSSPKFDEAGTLAVLQWDKIFDYTVENYIGGGSFGRVFRVSFEPTNSHYALKVIKLTQNDVYFVMREISILRILSKNTSDSINSDLVLKSIKDFVYKDHVCILFPLLGCSLHDCMNHTNFTHFELPTQQYIIIQVLKALEYIHDNKIIHCDLKPDNIVFDCTEVLSTLDEAPETFHQKYLCPKVTLIDFGLARFKEESNRKEICNIVYRPPEVILRLGYQEVSDIWSLGCVLFVLWNGTNIFEKGHDEIHQLLLFTAALGDALEIMKKKFIQKTILQKG